MRSRNLEVTITIYDYDRLFCIFVAIVTIVIVTNIHRQIGLVIPLEGYLLHIILSGLLIAVALRYRYCSGATFAVAVAPLLLAESSGDSSAATFLATF